MFLNSYKNIVYYAKLIIKKIIVHNTSYSIGRHVVVIIINYYNNISHCKLLLKILILYALIKRYVNIF